MLLKDRCCSWGGSITVALTLLLLPSCSGLATRDGAIGSPTSRGISPGGNAPAVHSPLSPSLQRSASPASSTSRSLASSVACRATAATKKSGEEAFCLLHPEVNWLAVRQDWSHGQILRPARAASFRERVFTYGEEPHPRTVIDILQLPPKATTGSSRWELLDSGARELLITYVSDKDSPLLHATGKVIEVRGQVAREVEMYRDKGGNRDFRQIVWHTRSSDGAFIKWSVYTSSTLYSEAQTIQYVNSLLEFSP